MFRSSGFRVDFFIDNRSGNSELQRRPGHLLAAADVDCVLPVGPPWAECRSPSPPPTPHSLQDMSYPHFTDEETLTQLEHGGAWIQAGRFWKLLPDPGTPLWLRPELLSLESVNPLGCPW